MKCLLTIQWPAAEIESYDDLIELENLLVENLPSSNVLDGHDMGAGEANIFILTDDAEKTFQHVRKLIRSKSFWDAARVAYREVAGDKYTILWPHDLKTFHVS